MNIKKFFIYSLLIIRSSFLICAQPSTNYSKEAEDFIKNNTLSDAEKSLISKGLYDTIQCFNSTGKALAGSASQIQNKASFDALAKNFTSNFNNLKKPLGDQLAQMQAYYTVLYTDLAQQKKQGSLKSLDSK